MLGIFLEACFLSRQFAVSNEEPILPDDFPSSIFEPVVHARFCLFFG